ncbi:hypothetical protein SLS60_002753 [Paraconiothyrium brasiliense]|uniref:Uncharacterized protein n=1 Tax=Paraconiothyrium brasiliense TaxID=300254 RepID=A0ABR3RTT6_9PLEO
MPPKAGPSLRENPNEIHRTTSTKKPPLPRTGSRASKYAHIGPKVDSKLAPEFIPPDSTFQRPKHKRGSLYFRSDGKAQENELEEEDEVCRLHSDSSDGTLYENASDHGSPPPSGYSTDAEADILAHFGGSHATSSPPYQRDHDSPPFPSAHSSHASSRKSTLEHPTSNPAAYARNTDSYKNKMNEPLEYNTSEPSTPGSGLQILPRLPLFRQQSVKFNEPTRPPNPSLHDRRRGQSLHTRPLLETTFLKSIRDALNITCDDLLDARDALFSGDRMLDFREVLQEQEGFPPDVNGLRHKIVEVIECLERQYAEDFKILEEIEKKDLEKESEKIEIYKQRVEELEEELRTNGEEQQRKERENGIRNAEREERILELEGALQTSNEERERAQIDEQEAQKKLEETSHTLKTQAQQLYDAAILSETQASKIEQLEASLQDRPAVSVSLEELQAAYRLHEQDTQKIQQLEEALQALQVKRVNDALATGTDTPEWHDVFKRGLEIRAAQQNEIMHLKTSIQKLNVYHLDVEREVQALREYVTLHRDTVQTLQEKLSSSKSQTKQWKAEYKQQKEMLDQRANREETTLSALREEMHLTISSYQSLLPTPSHPDALEITGLLRKLESQDHHLKDVTQRLETLKKEKASLETSIQKLLQENSDLRHGPPPLPRVIIHPETQEELHLPVWNRLERVTQRETALSAFRREQEAVRKREEIESKLLQKAREWKMGANYPPSRREYQKQAKKNEWERWEVKRWVEEMATDEEYEEIYGAGLLEGKKKRRSVKWKGKDRGSMGLRAWEVEGE